MSARRWFVALAVLLGALAGCATAGPKSELYEKVGRGDLTLGALRVIMRDCARRFPAVLEQAATVAGEGPTTPELRLRLTEFKANGVPLVQTVLLQQDPVAALLDGWALLYQLRDYLVRGTLDPPRRAEAVRTVEGLAEELARLWASVTGRPDVGPARARVEAWARAHPLRGSLLARDSTAPLLAGLLGRDELSVMAAAGTAIGSVEDALARLDLYAVNLPRHARWQAEAAVLELGASPEAGRALASLDRAMASLDRALDLVEPLSELAGETDAIIARERTAVLAQMDRERMALEGFFREERLAMVAALATERDAALQQADGIAHGLVDRTFDRLQRFLLRAAALALGLILVAAVCGWLLLSRGRRRGVAAPSPGPGARARLTEREA